jgi:hypothetical protein
MREMIMGSFVKVAARSGAEVLKMPSARFEAREADQSLLKLGPRPSALVLVTA